jgi:hypothetical protein
MVYVQDLMLEPRKLLRKWRKLSKIQMIKHLVTSPESKLPNGKTKDMTRRKLINHVLIL